MAPDEQKLRYLSFIISHHYNVRPYWCRLHTWYRVHIYVSITTRKEEKKSKIFVFKILERSRSMPWQDGRAKNPVVRNATVTVGYLLFRNFGIGCPLECVKIIRFSFSDICCPVPRHNVCALPFRSFCRHQSIHITRWPLPVELIYRLTFTSI